MHSHTQKVEGAMLAIMLIWGKKHAQRMMVQCNICSQHTHSGSRHRIHLTARTSS